VARGYVASSGAVPGVSSRPERIRFPVTVTDGTLDMTLEADRTVGNWWHPRRLSGDTWRLTQMRVFASQRQPPAARAAITYGWLESDLTAVPLAPNEVARLNDARLHTCMRSKSPRGTSRADLPPVDYEAELMFARRGTGKREGSVRMDVKLQGKRVLVEFYGGAYDEPVVPTYAVHVEASGHLELGFERSGGENEWGVSALILRPAE